MTIFNGLLESNCENNFFRDLAQFMLVRVRKDLAK